MKHLKQYYMSPLNCIRAYFQGGGRLTVNKALSMFHTTELRKIVSRLRREGYDIRSNRMCDEKSIGRKVYFNEYYLANENV